MQSFLQPQKDARISSKGMQITSLKYGNVKRMHAASKQIYCSRISSIFLNIENKANKATQKTGKLFYNHNANASHWIHTNGTIILQFNNVVIFGLWILTFFHQMMLLYKLYFRHGYCYKREKWIQSHCELVFDLFFASNENLECK